MTLEHFKPERIQTAGDTYLVANIRLRYSTSRQEWFLECNGEQGTPGAFRRNLTDERTVEFLRALMERVTLSPDA